MAELLLLGQVDNIAAPASAAAELYVLSSGYGSPVGTATPMLIETADIAPAGPGGRVLWRRAMVPFLRENTTTIKVTAIADFDTEVASTSEVFQSPATIAKTMVNLPIANSCTYLRERIEVTALAGRVQVFAPTALVRPVKSASPILVSASAT